MTAGTRYIRQQRPGVLAATVARDAQRSVAAELAAIERRPRDEQVDALLIYGLEREQVVDVAYSESRIDNMITALDVDPPVRDVVRRAVLWLQRDEALHAQYLRGRLLRSRSRRAHASIFAAQVVGAVGGWCASVSPRHGDDAFLLRRWVARSILTVGSIAGQIPRTLAVALQQPGFEAFCRVNAVLESSAIRAYEALISLATPEDRPYFERILADEERHLRVFELFLEMFEGDTLRPTETIDTLIEGLAEISPWLVAAERRGSPQLASRPVVVAAEDDRAHEAVRRALDSCDLPATVSGKSVALRTNFMLTYHRADPTTFVAPTVLGAIVAELRTAGAADVTVLDAPNIYGRYFGGRSVAEVASYIGLEEPADGSFRLADATDDLTPLDTARGLVDTKACRDWVEADVRIVVAKLAGDPAEVVHGALATIPGLAGRVEDEQFYTHRLIDHRTSAMVLLEAAPVDLAIVDAWGPLGDGPLGVMGCRRPSRQRRIYAGTDPAAVDATVISDMGVDASASEILRRADQWFGTDYVDAARPSELGTLDGFRAPQGTLWFRLISATAVPVYSGLSCRGRLFVPRFDQQAFPSIDHPGRFVRTVRWLAQQVFGLHPSKVPA